MILVREAQPFLIALNQSPKVIAEITNCWTYTCHSIIVPVPKDGENLCQPNYRPLQASYTTSGASARKIHNSCTPFSYRRLTRLTDDWLKLFFNLTKAFNAVPYMVLTIKHNLLALTSTK